LIIYIRYLTEKIILIDNWLVYSFLSVLKGKSIFRS